MFCNPARGVSGRTDSGPWKSGRMASRCARPAGQAGRTESQGRRTRDGRGRSICTTVARPLRKRPRIGTNRLSRCQTIARTNGKPDGKRRRREVGGDGAVVTVPRAGPDDVPRRLRKSSRPYCCIAQRQAVYRLRRSLSRIILCPGCHQDENGPCRRLPAGPAVPGTSPGRIS